MEDFCQNVGRLVINYRTLQHCKPRRKEYANLHGKELCLLQTMVDASVYALDFWPSCAMDTRRKIKFKGS